MPGRGAEAPTFTPALVGHEAVTDPRWAIKRMRPRHIQLLILITQGVTVSEAAERVGYSLNRATMIFNSPLFQENYRRVVEAQLGKAADGVYGALGVFRANAEEAAKIVVNLAKHARNDNVRYNAAKDILDRVGLAPVKRAEVLNVNELLDQMTAHELDAYIADGIWPERLRDKVTALAQARRPDTIDITPRASDG